MNGQRAVAVVLLACSVFAIGTMSASLDAAVTSSPDDAIDVDTDSLPFMGDGASEIADSYKQDEGGSDRVEIQSGSDGAAGGGGDRPQDQQRPRGGDAQPQAAGGQPSGDSSSGAGGREGSQSNSGGDGGAGSGESQGPEESIWALLEQLLAAVFALAALLALLAAGLFLVRRRRQLLARLRALARRYGLLADGHHPAGTAPGPHEDGEVDTIVERAWGEMIRASGARPRPSATPRECASAAVAAGVDREPAEALTDLYEQVRYGERPASPDQVTRALESLQEVAPERGVRLADGGSTSERSGSDGWGGERGT